MKTNAVKAVLASAGALAAGSAFAVDVTAVETELSVALGNVETIGAAVLLISVAVAVFKYVKKAL